MEKTIYQPKNQFEMELTQVYDDLCCAFVMKLLNEKNLQRVKDIYTLRNELQYVSPIERIKAMMNFIESSN